MLGSEKMQKHILVIAQYFYPEQFRINDICSEWVEKGYQVTVITGIPNYPQGKYYKGYGFFKKRKDNYKGVNVIRIPLIPRGKNSIMLVLNYLSFVVSGYVWKVFTKIKADYVFIFEVSPMTQALPGVWYAKKQNIPCYLYVQDLWPENVEIVTGIKNRRIIGAIEKMVDYIYKNSTFIFTTSKSFVKAIINRNVAEKKVKYWPQYAEDFYNPVGKNFKSGIPLDNKLNIVFTGNIGFAQGLDLLPKVAVILAKQGFSNKIRFNIVGEGRFKETLQKEIELNKIQDMFYFHGQKLPEEIPNILGDSDLAYLSFANEDLFNMTIPAKLQSYLACGIPILASAGGETKNIIKESESGFCTETGNEELLVESIKKYVSLSVEERKEMGKNARIYYEENFDKEQLLKIMDEYFRD